MNLKTCKQKGDELSLKENGAESLDDLKPTDEQSSDIKGGHGVTVLAWARVDGVAPSN